MAAVNRTIRGFDYQLSGPLIISGFFCIMGNCKATSHDTKTPPGGCALRARGRWPLSQPRVVAYAFMENNKRRMTNLKEEERWRNFYLLLNQ